MIGIDTNILMRHTLADDAGQTPLASAFLMDEARLTQPALIDPVVLVEFVWTLARRERFGKPDIPALLDVLVASRRVAFTDERAVLGAIETWRTGGADFPDYRIGYLNRQAGAATTVTFDQVAAREPVFSHLSA